MRDKKWVLEQIKTLVMGGAGFSHQLQSDPSSSSVVEVIQRALDLGIRAFDTSPYYEPSEQLMGAAFQDTRIASLYPRSEYVLMTKVGRIREHLFDYSPDWIEKSVQRSLDRFGTTYLDVVFCHDVEFVSKEAAIRAVGVLFDIAKRGAISCVGISGYDIGVLVDIAAEMQKVYGQPLDVVQNWGQMNLQNTRLEKYGLLYLKQTGVKVVCNASPLAIGLLRSEGVPVGSLGNWHPAPEGLRVKARLAADHIASEGDQLSSLALRFAMWRACSNISPEFVVTTITGISSLRDVEENVNTVRNFMRLNRSLEIADDLATSPPLHLLTEIRENELRKDERLYQEVRDILGHWLDHELVKSRASFHPQS